MSTAVGESRWSELGWLVALGAIWGSAFPIIRAGLESGAAPIAYGAARFAIATAAMAVIAAASRDRFPDRRTVALLAVYGGGFAIAGYAGFLYPGEEYITGGLASIVVATAPLWTVLISRFLLPGDRLGRSGSVGIVAGFAGVVVLFLPDIVAGQRDAIIGGALTLGAILSFVIGSVMLKRTMSAATGPWGLTVQFTAASALLAVVALAPQTGGFVLPANIGVLGTLVWLAAVPSVIGYTIYFRIHHTAGPTRANLVAYVNPVAGVLVGVTLFAEAVTWNEIAGFALVLAGLFLLHRERRPTPAGSAAASPADPAGTPSSAGSGSPPTPPTR